MILKLFDSDLYSWVLISVGSGKTCFMPPKEFGTKKPRDREKQQKSVVSDLLIIRAVTIAVEYSSSNYFDGGLRPVSQ